MNDDLSRDLSSLAPELDASMLLDGASRKRRRARRRTTALAATLAVVILTSLGAGLGSVLRSSPPQPAASSNSDDPQVYPSDIVQEQPGEHHPAWELMSSECQEALSVAPGDLDRTPAGGLPQGVSTVWLCGELGTAEGAWIGPRAPLVTHAAEAVAAINALPVAEEQCSEPDAHRYRMVVDYPDRRHVLDAQLSSCGGVGETKVGGEQLLTRLKALFVEERRTGSGTRTPVVCPGSGPVEDGHPLFPVTGAEITQGVFCAFIEHDRTAQREVPVELLTSLRDAPWEPVDDQEPWPDLRGFLAVADEFGDTVFIFRTVTGELRLQGDLGWRPDARTAAQIGELFDDVAWEDMTAPCHTTQHTAETEVNDIVGVHICTRPRAISDDGSAVGYQDYSLPFGLAQRVVAEFNDNAVPGTSGHDANTSTVLLLVDSEGRGIPLSPGPDHTLIDTVNNRTWQISDHLRLSLTARGLHFP